MSPDATPTPGTLLTVSLPNGLSGACRILRSPNAGEDQYAGRVLVCATPFVGEAGAALKSPDAKKILKLRSGPAVYWIEGAPPSSFATKGSLSVKGDTDRTSHSTAPWEMLPNAVYAVWREANEPAAVRAEKDANVASSQRQPDAQLERLRATDRVDLDGLVPLPTPKTERAPRDVLLGFMAAMHRWERESHRVATTNGPSLAVRFNRPALDAIFAEFCTAKERPNGRLGSFSDPPEYDPERETIMSVNEVGRRIEIDTRRVDGRVVRYVLVKAQGCWLVDSKKVDGRNGIL